MEGEQQLMPGEIIAHPPRTPEDISQAFYKRVVGRRTSSGKVQLHAVLISPTIPYLPGELTAAFCLDFTQ